MYFDFYGDEITYDGRPIARLLPVPLGFRRQIEDALQAIPTEEDLEQDRERAIKLAEEEAFDNGKDAGKQEAKEEHDDEIERIEEEAFEKGHASALRTIEAASDPARVLAAKTAIMKVHDLLLPLLHGVEEPGKFKRRTAKTSEVKKAAGLSLSEIRSALRALDPDVFA